MHWFLTPGWIGFRGFDRVQSDPVWVVFILQWIGTLDVYGSATDAQDCLSGRSGLARIPFYPTAVAPAKRLGRQIAVE